MSHKSYGRTDLDKVQAAMKDRVRVAAVHIGNRKPDDRFVQELRPAFDQIPSLGTVEDMEHGHYHTATGRCLR